MKNLLYIYLMLVSSEAFAQPSTMEGLGGHKNYWYQHIFQKRFNQNSKAGFFNVSSLQINYEQESKNEVMTQSYLTYTLAKGVTVAAGTFYATGAGFSPSIAIQFYNMHNNLFWLLVPRVDIQKHGAVEAMALVEYTPKVLDKLKLYSRAQLMSNYTSYTHNRSYQHFRIGLGIRQVQFGLAYNIDEFGPDAATGDNAGVFVRAQF